MRRREPVRLSSSAVPEQEPRPYDETRHEQLLQALRRALIDIAPDDWRRIDFKILMLAGACEIDLSVTRQNNAYPLVEPVPELADLSAELRSIMYRPGEGTWYGMRLMIDPPDTSWVTYNRTFDPLWDPPLPAKEWQRDLAAFPRTDDNTPPWLHALRGSAVGLSDG